MRLVAYLRVSTDRQAEQGLGLDVQRQTIQRWAREGRHRVVLWAVDEGVSGSNGLETRDALPEAVEALRSRQAEGLVVYRLDRLARDLIIQETLLGQFQRLGAQVFSCSAAENAVMGDDEDDPTRRMVRVILGAVSEFERSMIRLRLRNGRRRKAERGGFAYGSPPLGFKAEQRELVPVESEQAVLARISDLYRQGLSLRGIAERLDSEGFSPKRGGSWHSETIRRIVARQKGTQGVS
jgi:DNA invertase Pin-like site-specific DNA recombinase